MRSMADEVQQKPQGKEIRSKLKEGWRCDILNQGQATSGGVSGLRITNDQSKKKQEKKQGKK